MNRPTSTQIVAAMQKHGLKPVTIAAGFGITVNTVYDWTSGRRQCAPYMLAAIEALAAGRLPASPADTQARWNMLGLTRQHAHLWKKRNATPRAAMYATAWMMAQYAGEVECTDRRAYEAKEIALKALKILT